MIKILKGNIANMSVGHIVHGCNAQGVMGSGVAKALRDKYPQIFKPYHDHCIRHKKVGIMGDVISVKISDDLIIHNAITQEYYGRDGRKYVSYDAVDLAMEEINTKLRVLDYEKKLYFPQIGAGLGGGDWSTIEAIIDNRIEDKFDKTLVLFNE